MLATSLTLLLVLLALALPVAGALGTLGVLLDQLYSTMPLTLALGEVAWSSSKDFLLVSIPMFILLGEILLRAGIAEKMYGAMVKWMSWLPGGLMHSNIGACTLFSATSGSSVATAATVGTVALPLVDKFGYNEKLFLGTLAAGGTLGILIPPSILAILFAVVAQQSVGELFVGAVIPGLILSGLYILFIIIYTTFKPEAGPPLPVDERVSFSEKIRLLNKMFAPIVLVMLVLGIIFAGIATPVEAAGVGTFGAIVVAAMHRRLSWENVRSAAITTLKVTGMVLWIIFGATLFVGFYVVNGGQEFVNDSLNGLGLGPYQILIVMMIMLIILGMFLDWVGILLLAVPIFVPIIKGLTFDGLFGLPAVPGEDVALWFGVLYLVNMQMSFLSPPFGYALFYIRGVCPPEISMATIFRSSLVFLALQTVGLALCVLIPGLSLWLPALVYG